MPSLLYVLIGIAFSCVSGYITWLSWRDTRRIYSILAKFEERISSLENSSNDNDKPLYS